MKKAFLLLAIAVTLSCQSPHADMSNFELVTHKRGNAVYNSPPDDARFHLFETCKAAGAKVTFFHNGCANYCSAIELGKMPICTMALAKSCLCPEPQCYDKENNQCRMPNRSLQVRQ
ncbi:MAG: hypothetical protein HON23_00060 [Rickettsiales bacterium]|jgi:hypothetical protein|nr:hypothetical protein [Rickettsiales bacterium]